MCSGTSFLRRASASTRRKTTGKRCALRRSRATSGSSFPCPKYRRRSAIRERNAARSAAHPVVFQKSLIENADQRAASQYISAFRAPGFDKMVEKNGYEWFFEKTFGGHVDLAKIPEAEKRQYVAEWSQPGAFNAMLNWYRAAKVMVPPPGLTVPLPDWLLRAFPKVRVPTLVVWGMKDAALLPIQLDGLDELVEDLTIVQLPNTGHFAPWEAPDEVSAALRHFLAADA